MSKLNWLILIFTISLFVSSKNAVSPIRTSRTGLAIPVHSLATGDDLQCIQSFSDFAFGGPKYWSQRQTTASSEWQNESVIPLASDLLGSNYPSLSVELSRLINGHQEIWVRGLDKDGPVWLIYKSESKEWESISRRIGKTNFYSADLYATSDGTLWSKTQVYSPFEKNQTFPVLTKFNEASRQFEIPQGMKELSLVQEKKYYYGQSFSPWPEIILDKHDIFWFFANYDGLYRYDPATHIAEKRIEIANFPIQSATLAPDGSLYFSKPTDHVNTTRSLYSLSKGMLFQFIPETNEFITISVPDTEWPIFNGMLADRKGRLWLGSIGYSESDGTWNLLHPNPEEFFNHAGDETWSSPLLIMETSDGRLWYNRYLDGVGDGTAWYDPKTGEGCLFTNVPAKVIEDSNQQLWMVADGYLYRYRLNTH